jgi:cyclin H
LHDQEAQISLGHESKDPTPQASYLSVEDELLLLRQYLTQAALVRQSFYLPEYVESTAMTYLKRFYLRNSVMDWHPKAIM